MYVIVSGRVKLTVAAEDGREFALEVFGPGDVCGLIAALDGGPNNGTAITLSTCRVAAVPRDRFESWIAQHPRSFPPIVVHITDGESQDGDPVAYADAIRKLATSDGNVLLFNCHLSATAADPFMFPAKPDGLPDKLAKMLFEMSSVLPDRFHRYAAEEGFELQAAARGMAFNANMVCLIQFLNMGTQAAAILR